jgi:hypothetical protein
VYLLFFGLLLGLSISVHLYLLGEKINDVSFSLVYVYLFHAIFSFLLCSIFLVLGTSEKWQAQLGFLYLGALIFKVLLFSVIFSSTLFGEEVLTLTEKISLLIPVFIFLVPEVYFISKILMKIDSIKN